MSEAMAARPAAKQQEGEMSGDEQAPSPSGPDEALITAAWRRGRHRGGRP